jgi:hypothetical protein
MFYAEAYKMAVAEVGGEQYILSAVALAIAAAVTCGDPLSFDAE